MHHHTHCCSGAGSHCLRHWCLHFLKCYAIYIVGIERRRLLQSSRHSVMVTTNHVMATPVIERAHSLAQCTLLLDQSHNRHYLSPAFASPVVNVQRACVSVGRGSLPCATSELPYRFELLILSTGLELGEPQLEEARRVLMLWQWRSSVIVVASQIAEQHTVPQSTPCTLECCIVKMVHSAKAADAAAAAECQR